MPEDETPDLKPPCDGALEVLNLGNEGAGRWRVETASRSSYLVTADEEGCVTFVRTPRSAPSRPVDAEWPSADLRGDGAVVGREAQAHQPRRRSEVAALPPEGRPRD